MNMELFNKASLGVGAIAAAATAVVLYLMAPEQAFLTPEIGNALLVVISFIGGSAAIKAKS